LDLFEGGVKSDPPNQTLQSPVGVVINQWGVKSPNPPDKSNTGCGVARLWEVQVASCDFLLSRNLTKIYVCVCFVWWA